MKHRETTWVVMAWILVLAGCGFFEPRSAVPPVAPPDIPRKDPQDPDSVLFNYEHAVRFGTQGRTQLSETMTEEFLLFLSPSDAGDVGFDSYGRDSKLDGYRNQAIAAGNDTFYFKLGYEDRTPTPVDGGFRYDTLSYHFEAYARVADTLQVVEAVSGQATLFFVLLSNSTYSLLRWVDVTDNSGNRSWGRYLADFGASP